MKKGGPCIEKSVLSTQFPANAICANKDGTKIAIAGRKIFTIIDVTEKLKVLFDLCNLPQKQLNLNFSSNHVQWNPKDENQLASAPTNASVVLWDLNRRTKSKLSHVFEEVHQRAVNRLCYHPRETNILLSGSQDSTMVCFDTRQKNVVGRYTGPDSVRDVQYNPHNDHYFAACFENGSCQIWDRRHSEQAMKQIAAHVGPAYSCAWHLEQEHRIVSAGRDKMIKVHDIQTARAKEMNVINALFSVARVRWRPQHRNHLSSCSHLLDNTVAVWDTRRPFIQYATFSEHTDDVTDFLWLSEDVLLSCAKDCRLIQQSMTDASHPTDKATPVCISLRPDGPIARSCSDSCSQRTKTQHTSSALSRNPIQFRKQEVDPYQQSFLRHTSYLHEYINDEDRWLIHFKSCAKSYILEGQPVDKLCDHNYQVCLNHNKTDGARTWLLLKLLYCGQESQCSTLGLLPLHFTNDKHKELSESEKQLRGSQEISDRESSDPLSISQKKDKISSTPEGETTEEETDIAGVLEFFEYNESDSDSSTSGSVSQTPQELELPKEPFQLRQDIVSRGGHSLEVPEIESNSHSGVLSFGSSGHRSSQHTHASSHSQKPFPPGLTLPIWDYSQQVVAMLKHYAEKGDVQMSVTVVLVLGEKLIRLIPETVLLQWFYSYIDLLTQYQLLTEAAYITKLCPLKQVKETSQSSTLYVIGCDRCNKILGPQKSTCLKCETCLNLCSVCHTPVKGLYSWCEICGHGGHFSHLKQWFSNNKWCPSGCGHTCLTN